MHLYDYEDAVDVTVAALEGGQTVEELAKYFTDVLNAAQRKYEQEHKEKRRAEAAETLAKALSVFGEAFTGEAVPVEADSLVELGNELAKLVHGLGNAGIVRARIPADENGLQALAESFWKTK